MKREYMDLSAIFSMVMTLVVLLSVPLAAWGTHVINCIQKEEWMFLIAGAIAFPVGVVHGVGIWFGVW
jgi:presenilin-like A22 family membrane protease